MPTAVVLAVYLGRHEVLSLLLDKKADPNLINKSTGVFLIFIGPLCISQHI
jgi:hypothetical protein